jgi:alpha-amylase/alpha-mannosidase (GH57 family)
MQSQIADALAMHTRHFGAAPTGVWPAEGAISTALVKLLADNGCRWLASGERVLRNSLTESGIDCAQSPYRPWHLADTPGLTLFFRDEGLSDLIGFEYSRWHGRDAALHFIAQLDAIRAAPGGESSVVSVILDGENAWEHYPYNGYHFFEDLYTLLETSDSIQTTTYSELLQRTHPPAPSTLARLVAGSWVYGTMSTWIGDADKNRAWDLLCEAKRRYDEVLASGQLSPDEVGAAQAQLAVCESSDWFWWFGDYNPAAAVVSFDRLFRHNLACLYRRIGLNPPDQLAIPLSHGDEDATDGTMRRASNAVES